jgi:poly-beta-1,6-N-acetyl-D-glucosamine synthase
MQMEEQAALLGMAMGSAMQGQPALAYGANLAFTRRAFLTIGGYEGDRYASGDDLFLLQRIVRSGGRVTSLYDPRTLVLATAAPSFRSFVQQRLRWAGKMRGAGLGAAVGGLIALLFPWALLWQTLLFELPGSIGDHAVFNAALLIGAWACWSLPTLAMVRDVRGSFARPNNEWAAVLGLIVFSFYAPLIAVAGLAAKPMWKGRRI